MARFDYGGVMAAWIVSTVASDEEFGTGTKALLLPAEDAALDIYDAPDGSLVTDFLDAAGVAVSTIVVPAGTGTIPRFSGPDGAEALWVQNFDASWVPMPRFTTDGTGTGAGGAGDVLLAGGNSHEYANSQSPPWLILKRPNDNSASTAWKNMVELWYWDNATSTYRLGFYVNEKGLLRTRGVTPSDVVARFMAHPSQSVTAAILEATLDDNAVKLFQVTTASVVINLPVIVPYLVNPKGERLYWGTGDPVTDPAYANYRPDVGAAWINYNDPPAGGA